jgi:hypothetical protein
MAPRRIFGLKAARQSIYAGNIEISSDIEPTDVENDMCIRTFSGTP